MDQLPSRCGAGRLLRVALAVALLGTGACSEEPVASARANYAPDAPRVCANREAPRSTDDEPRTSGGTRYHVRVPANYDPGIAHPLLVVYPGAGQSGRQSERHTGLTPDATAAGFVVAYVDHRRLSLPVLDDFAKIPEAVAAQWCIDSTRVFVTGHSDGGTAAAAMAFRDDDGFVPTAIAPSAAGITAQDLAQYDCPNPLPVLVMHSREDKLFPGFGRSAAQWWAACNGCADTTLNDAAACIDFEACPAQAPVRYCAGEGSHRRWPARNAMLLQFFDAVRVVETTR